MRHNFNSVNVSTIIFNQKGQVLLGKRSMDEDVYPGLWCIPGGKIDVEPCEDGVIEKNLQREVREEIGIEIEPVFYLTSNCLLNGDEAKLYLIFVSEHISGDPRALDGTEQVKWFDIEELSHDMLTPRTFDNIHHASDRRISL
ncbi:MAG: NUDIX hydrolase [Parcubacteria group bacterium GW2011_GWF2_38_76]|nr:MAG: NUDIX hydrolase [Parcubacteria group bacterium GW2011_GWF2_38_76]